MEFLKRLDYTAVGIGENECALPFIEGLANFALNNQVNNIQQAPHVLAGNLSQRANQFPGAEAVAFREAGNGVPNSGGVAGLIGGSVCGGVALMGSTR